MNRGSDHQLTENCRCPESEYSHLGGIGIAGNVGTDGPTATESTVVPVQLGSESAMPAKYVNLGSAHSLGYLSPGLSQEAYPTMDQRKDELESNICSRAPSSSSPPCSSEKPSYSVFRLQLRSPQYPNSERIISGEEGLQMEGSRTRLRNMRQAVTSPRRAETPRVVTEPRRSTRFSEQWTLELEPSTSINHQADQSGLSQTDAGADNYDSVASLPSAEREMSLVSGTETGTSSFWDVHEPHGSRNHNRIAGAGERASSFEMACDVRTHDKGARTYEEWLTLKRKEAYQQQRLQRREAHRLTVAVRVRKQMSDQCYSDWLASKQQRHLGARIPGIKSAFGSDDSGAGVPSKPMTSIKTPTSAHMPFIQVKSAPRGSTLAGGSGRKPSRTPEEVQRRVEQWDLKKMREQERQRSVKQREEAELQEIAAERGRQSKLAWQRWVARAADKRRPVPLNRGLELLAGSTAPIYVVSKHGRPPVVPLSAAQRALRQRLDEIDGVRMYRRPK
ncbi:uncharacterized protein LOC111072119 [Drosophila obscura]|uniref:uncharacterized protein LOC111072119 n=1 Tax=Drosophila obscura TaxID=7282 RepID=UPI001BB16E2A|nr:uncharacterized protein LOC111072119 [Drosophila obscura]